MEIVIAFSLLGFFFYQISKVAIDRDERNSTSEPKGDMEYYEKVEKRLGLMPLYIAIFSIILMSTGSWLVYTLAAFILLIICPVSVVAVIFSSIKLSRVSILGLASLLLNVLIFCFLFSYLYSVTNG